MSTASSDGHATGGQSQALLYDPKLPTSSHAERARTLAAQVGTGTLCTLALEPAGFPYGSFVLFALDVGSPVFLISEMAEHTRNLRADPRASLLVVEPGQGDPLSRGRVTLVGPCAPIEAVQQPTALAALVAAHPGVARYADFRDFHLWRLTVEAVRYIGGFGRMSWIEPTEWMRATPDPLADEAPGILRHMNEDHAAAMLDYCHAFSRATDASSASMTGLDRYGVELSAITAAGARPIRIAFSRPLERAEEVRAELIALAKAARRALAGPG